MFNDFHDDFAKIKATAFAICQPRSNYELEHFLSFPGESPEWKFYRYTIELHTLSIAIQRTALQKQQILDEGDELDAGRHGNLAKMRLSLDLDELEIVHAGQMREFDCLFRLWSQMTPCKREGLESAEAKHWKEHFARLANQDIIAYGSVQTKTQEMMLQTGMTLTEIARLSRADRLINTTDPKEVEDRYLDIKETKVLIVVPTEKPASSLPVLDTLEVPTGAQLQVINIHSFPVAEAYNRAVAAAMQGEATHLLCVEDDTFPPPDAFAKLMKMCWDDPLVIAGGYYPKRGNINEGTAIVLKEGHREALMPDGKVHEVYTIPQGCTLIPMSIFHKIPGPWFVTTPNMTQDSYFSQLAREAGYKLLVDTSIRCRHVDRVTGKEYV